MRYDIINQDSTVGVVIFAKNEEKSIIDIIDKVLNYVSLENIFVVDGHSRDNTVSLAQGRGVAVLTDSKKGKGCAVQLAINSIDRDILVFLDADGSHRPEEISTLLAAFLADESVTLVIGSRFKGGSEELREGFCERIRLLGNRISTFTVNKIWKTNLTDVQNGFRAVKRRKMQELNLTENSFAIEQEMVMKCLKKGDGVIEVPSWELRRKHNKSHINPLRMFPLYILSFIKNILSRQPEDHRHSCG